MNNATPIEQLPYIPQQGSNDPRVLNEVMMDTHKQQPQHQGSGDVLSDPVIKDAIIMAILYVLLNSDIVNNLLLQYVPTMVRIGETHLQTTVIKALGLGAAVYVLKKYLM
jgi:hypothetical protein